MFVDRKPRVVSIPWTTLDKDVTFVSTQSLHGIVSYDPQEFVVTDAGWDEGL